MNSHVSGVLAQNTRVAVEERSLRLAAEARIEKALAVVAGEMRCECWLPDYMEFGPPCPKCLLLEALGVEDVIDVDVPDKKAGAA